MDLNMIQKLKSKPLIAFTFIASGLLIYPTIVKAEGRWWNIGAKILNVFSNKKAGELTLNDIGDGLKEALRVSSENVVNQLGQPDGFNGDATIYIPLPPELGRVEAVLDRIGMSSLLDDLKLKLNRAAEAATPPAKELFWQAIKELSFADIKAIYDGPTDAATSYFREKMSPGLAVAMRPIITDSLTQIGAIQAFDAVMGKYQSLPFVPDIKADLTEYVVGKGIDGIFHYMAIEEMAIRSDPAKRTTEILKRVFGSK